MPSEILAHDAMHLMAPPAEIGDGSPRVRPCSKHVFRETEWSGRGSYRQTAGRVDFMNELVHVILDGAGDSERASVVVASSISDGRYGKLKMQDTTLRNGLGDGLWMQNDASSDGGELVDFARNRFERIELAPVRTLANQIYALDDATDYRGPEGHENGLAYIHLTQGSHVVSSQTWGSTNVPYRFFDNVLMIEGSGVVTILPGVELEFTLDTGLEVHGTLSADGTRADNTFEGNTKGDVAYHSVCSPAGTC